MSKLSEPTTEGRVSDSIPELFHYTNSSGLKGICETQTLRATRFDGLNDKAEIIHFRDYLQNAVRANTKKKIIANRARRLSETIRLEKNGGPSQAYEDDLTSFISTCYECAFTGIESGTAVFPPYITSFCSHSSSMPYECENGLLSQWRGYGDNKDGRFAIVFDTAEIERKLSREEKTFEYSNLQLADAIYMDEKFDFEKKFAAEIRSFSETFSNFISDDSNTFDNLMNVLPGFISGASRLKHQGFKEECEVRIIACPMSEIQRAEITKESIQTGKSIKAIKQREQRPKKNRQVEFISLFNNPTGKLPIKRIIVGPSNDQKSLVKVARSLAGSDARISTSQTPYID